MQNEICASQSSITQDHKTILSRLDRIEAALGISPYINEGGGVSSSDDMGPDEDSNDAPLDGVWRAIAHLRSITGPFEDERVWSRPIVKQLWGSCVTTSLPTESKTLFDRASGF